MMRTKIGYFFLFVLMIFTFQIDGKEINKFIVITPEKCGTMMLSKSLRLITGRNGIHYYPRKVNDLQHFLSFVVDAHQRNKFVFCHVSPDADVIAALKKKKYKVFFIIRDPRDQLISGMFMIRDGHALAGIPPAEFVNLEESDQIEELITGDLFGKPIFEICYARQLPWMKEKSSFVHVSRFEDLVGSKGGGDDKKQIKELKSLAKHVGMKLPTKSAKGVAKKLFGGTWSFRNGMIGSYQNYFSESHTELFLAKYYGFMVDLGYLSDN